MFVCSCSVITERDIDWAVSEIMTTSPVLIPTPGVVFRYLKKSMKCCTCAPIAVAAIYNAMDRLSCNGQISPFDLEKAREKLVRIEQRYGLRQERTERRAA